MRQMVSYSMNNSDAVEKMHVNVEEAKRLLERGGYKLLDVR